MPKVLNKRMVKIRFLHRQDFLKYYLPDVGIGGFQWVVGNNVQLENQVTVRFSFVGHTEPFELDANVVWRKSSPPMKPSFPPGIGFEFRSSSKKTLTDLLRFVVEKQDGLMHVRDDREERRVKVSLGCEYLYKDELVKASVANLSTKGVHFRSKHMLEEGQPLIFFLNDTQFLRPMVLEGNVIWSDATADPPGFGVELRYDSRKNKQDVKRYISSLTDDFEDDA